MKNWVKNTIIFVSGVAVGGLTATLIAKKYYKEKYEDIAEEKIASMKKYVDELRAKDEAGKYSENLQYTAKSDPDVVENDEKVEKEAPRHEKINYHGVSEGWIEKKKAQKDRIMEEIRAEMEHPQEEDEEDPGYLSEKARSKERSDESNSGVRPRVISEEEFGFLNGYNITSLDYYITDGVLVEEGSDEQIMDYMLILGDCMETSGFDVNDEDELIVLNKSVGTVYVIHKIFQYFNYED